MEFVILYGIVIVGMILVVALSIKYRNLSDQIIDIYHRIKYLERYLPKTESQQRVDKTYSVTVFSACDEILMSKTVRAADCQVSQQKLILCDKSNSVVFIVKIPEGCYYTCLANDLDADKNLLGSETFIPHTEPQDLAAAEGI